MQVWRISKELYRDAAFTGEGARLYAGRWNSWITFDEKTAIQAGSLFDNRLDPALPLSPGRIQRHGFEYRRHGTLCCTLRWRRPRAACTAKPQRATPARTRVIFLEEVVAQCPANGQIHIYPRQPR